jgi:hypothetical protein
MLTSNMIKEGMRHKYVNYVKKNWEFCKWFDIIIENLIGFISAKDAWELYVNSVDNKNIRFNIVLYK